METRCVVIVLVFSICFHSCLTRTDVPGTGAPNGTIPRTPVHIHQHNGMLTSPNATDITEEESMYFVNKLFGMYGFDERINMSGLQHILDNLGFEKDEQGQRYGSEGQHRDKEKFSDGHSHGHGQSSGHQTRDEEKIDDIDTHVHGHSEHHHGHVDNSEEDRGYEQKPEMAVTRGFTLDNEDAEIQTSGEMSMIVESTVREVESTTQKMTPRPKKHRRRKGRRNRKGKSRKGKKLRTDRKGDRERRSALSSVIFHIHDKHSDCLDVHELLEIFHLDNKMKISKLDFLYISPAIIYQLNKPKCRRPSSEPVHHHGTTDQSGERSWRVWVYSIASILVISLTGLLAVALVPIMQRLFFKQLLQFLVAMAVGALTGDALLHLLPHAISSSEFGQDEGHSHSSSVWKGLCSLLGIHVFFIIQRLLTIITGVRNKRRLRKSFQQPQGEITIGKAGRAETDVNTFDSVVCSDSEDDVSSHEPLEPLKSHQADDNHNEGHGHSHGPAPKSMSAVALMVIMGDGIHNLSDGLAVGAAFASSITVGLSTAIAVFCHELPHEIGDFAVLLKSGVSVKHAIFFNCVSSFLCLVGVLIGVALGNIQEASSWIFAAIGGMFLYISMVTMVPELSSVDSKSPVRTLGIQLCGLALGTAIMLTIALYEDDLLQALE